jgi:hypothetical protein
MNGHVLCRQVFPLLSSILVSVVLFGCNRAGPKSAKVETVPARASDFFDSSSASGYEVVQVRIEAYGKKIESARYTDQGITVMMLGQFDDVQKAATAPLSNTQQAKLGRGVMLRLGGTKNPAVNVLARLAPLPAGTSSSASRKALVLQYQKSGSGVENLVYRIVQGRPTFIVTSAAQKETYSTKYEQIQYEPTREEQQALEQGLADVVVKGSQGESYFTMQARWLGVQ